MEEASTFTVPNLIADDSIVLTRKKKKTKTIVTYICWNKFK